MTKLIWNKRLRICYVTLREWSYRMYPTWSWMHSFYYYRNKKFLQFTIFGLNVAYKFK